MNIINLFFFCHVIQTYSENLLKDPRGESLLGARKAEIPVLTNAEINLDTNLTGLKGSPTKVKSTFTPPVKEGGTIIKEESDQASAAKAARMLSEAHII